MCVECTCSVYEDACGVFGGTVWPIVQFIRACDFANLYPTNSKLNRLLYIGVHVMAASCMLCGGQLLCVCVCWCTCASCVCVIFVCGLHLLQSCCWVSFQRGPHLLHYWWALQVHWHMTNTQCYWSTHHPACPLYMCTLWTAHLMASQVGFDVFVVVWYLSLVVHETLTSECQLIQFLVASFSMWGQQTSYVACRLERCHQVYRHVMYTTKLCAYCDMQLCQLPGNLH